MFLLQNEWSGFIFRSHAKHLKKVSLFSYKIFNNDYIVKRLTGWAIAILKKSPTIVDLLVIFTSSSGFVATNALVIFTAGWSGFVATNELVIDYQTLQML